MKKFLSILLALVMVMVPVNATKCMALESGVGTLSLSEEKQFSKVEESKSSKVLNEVKEHVGHILAIAAATGVAWSARNVYENYKNMLGIAKDSNLSLVFKIKMLGKMLFMGAYEKEQILTEIKSYLDGTISKNNEKISNLKNETEDEQAEVKDLKDETEILISYRNVIENSLSVINARKEEAKEIKAKETAEKDLLVAEENVKAAEEDFKVAQEALEKANENKTVKGELLEKANDTHSGKVNDTRLAEGNLTNATNSYKELLKGKNITRADNLFI